MQAVAYKVTLFGLFGFLDQPYTLKRCKAYTLNPNPQTVILNPKSAKTA